MHTDNPVEQVVQMIKSLGPDAVSAYCSYTSHEQAQSAANWIADHDKEFVSLARSKRAVIAVVNMADGTAVIFGGLMSVDHITRLYQSVLNIARPDKSVLAIPEVKPRPTARHVETLKPRPREGIVALTMIAAAAFATLIALLLTSRPYDPTNSTFGAQQTVPQAPVAIPSASQGSPQPTPTQTAIALETPQPASTTASAPTDDAAIQAQIEKALNADSALAQADVSTIVEGGRVTIVGSVRSGEMKQRVERTIRAIKGVASVDNQLVVIASSPQ
jgi:hypothetical protein